MTPGGSSARVSTCLARGVRVLEDHDVLDSRLDAEVWLAHVLAVDRSTLIAHPDRDLDAGELRRFQEGIEKRSRGCPLAYLIGAREFYGLDFEVSPAVLVPRPDTELLVDWALEWIERRNAEAPTRILDIGTGSGCIIVALAHELIRRGRRVIGQAVDISAEALAVAVSNATHHEVAGVIDFRPGDLFDGLDADGRFHLIVSNPPYVAHGDPRLEAGVAGWEPELAYRDRLDGDGLGYYRRLARSAASHLEPHGAILVEIGEDQAPAVERLFRKQSLRPETRKDLAGRDRAVLSERPDETRKPA